MKNLMPQSMIDIFIKRLNRLFAEGVDTSHPSVKRELMRLENVNMSIPKDVQELLDQHRPDPKYKKGDVCVYITEGFEDESTPPVMVIAGPASWNPYDRGYWEYPIEKRQNNCPEGLLKLKPEMTIINKIV